MDTVILYIGEFGMGGISRVIVRYANALNKLKKYNVEILSKEEPAKGNILLKELDEGIKVHYIKPKEMEERRNYLRKKKGIVNKLIKEYSRNRERVYMKGWLKDFFLQRSEIKVLIDFDMSIWKYLSVIPVPAVGRFSFSLESKYRKKGKKMNKRMKLYDKLLIITDEMQNQVERLYPFAANKTVRIYNPVGIEEVEKKSEDRIDLSDLEKKLLEEDYIVGVSILEKVKARDEMIAAMNKVKENGRKEKLYLIGGGSQKDELEKQIKQLGLQDQVYLLGQKKNPFIWLKNAKIFVHTSYGEGLPNVLLEAMSVGTPIISYDCPTGPKDILQEGQVGSLVEMGNVDMLAKEITDLLEDENRRKRYIEKMKIRREDFSIESSLRDFEKMLDEVIC